MPDAPISETLSLGLGQWAEDDNPGADALNENWERIDAAVMMHGDELPTEYQPGKLFLLTSEGTDATIYRNDGTLEEPAFTAVLDVASVAALVAAKAPQTQVDTLQTASDDHEGRLDDIEAAMADFVKKDGSVAMTGDLDLGGNKIVDLANGVDPDDAATVGQLDAAVDGALASLAGSYAYVLARNTGDLTDTSPVLFEADENDASTTEGDLHDVSEPSEFVATQDGFYMLVARMRVANGGGGSIKWLINGIEAPACVYPQVCHDVGENETFLQDVMMVGLEAGDVVTLGVYGLILEPVTIKEDSTVAMFLLAANAVGGGDMKADGSVPMTGNLDMGGNKIINLADGVDPDDAATVGQVDAAVDDLQGQIDDLETEGGNLTGDQRIITAGDQGFSTLDWEVVTNGATADMQVVVASGTKYVSIDAFGTALMDFEKRANLQIGIQVQKNADPPVNYPGTKCYDFLGYWVNGGMTAKTRLTLTVGTWTFRLVCRKLYPHANNPILGKNAAEPAYIGYDTTD